MRDGIAIVGMASLFPGAPDLATYWANVRGGVDAISDVPAGRWDPVFYNPSPESDRIYCKRGGFVDAYARFDPVAHGIMPVAARGAEPDQLLALDLATRALADAGYADRKFARDKAGVVLGRGNYRGAAHMRIEQHVRVAEQLIQVLRTLLPGLDAKQLQDVRAEFQGAVGHGGAEVAIGLVPNLTASRIAHQLDLAGPAFTLDAACASSLLAVDQACGELMSGRCDLMIAGGVHLCHDEAFWTVFSQLGALSRAQRMRPFDRRADGLLIGEGLGLLVLKRRADAERDDDRIYAVIRGSGVASDGRGTSLLQPRTEGQVLALTRAWQMAGLDPASVELVEAHGTATPTGDAVELETLRSFFGRADTGARATVGSVKSMIGHTMPAAGAAGLIKAALALYHAELPPTLHCEEPHPALAETRFRTLSRVEPWDREAGRAGVPRRAGVNAFGFGGVDAHIVLEEAHARVDGPRRARSAAPVSTTSSPTHVLCLAAPSRAALLALLAQVAAAFPALPNSSEGEGPCRVAIIDPDAERIASARTIIERGHAWRGRGGIWFTPRGLLADGGKLAFVFPGLDANFQPRVDDLASRLKLDLPAAIEPRSIEEVGVAIIGVNRLLYDAVSACGVRPDLLFGHSIGEWSGMLAAGITPPEAVTAFSAAIRSGTLEVPGVGFLAAGCSAERAIAALEGLTSIGLSHDNCPHQVVLCGVADSLETALQRMVAEGVICQRLPFGSGFHSPLFAPLLAPHRGKLVALPVRPSADLPLWSATTCDLYPHTAEEIWTLALRHLVEPVHFRKLVLKLHDQGARVFLQVGMGSVPGFIEDTLSGKPHVAIPTHVASRSGVEQLLHALAALYIEGAQPEFDRLLQSSVRHDVSAHALVTRTRTRTRSRTEIQLELGVPLVRLKGPLALPQAALPAHAAIDRGDPLAQAFSDVLDEVGRAQQVVLARFQTRANARPASAVADAHGANTPVHRTQRILSLETLPEVIDHTFFEQPAGWPVLSDRHPVVPLATSIELMIEVARELVPQRVVAGIEDVQALRWLVVSQPLAAEFIARFDGVDRVEVEIEGYASATVCFARAYAEPPAARVLGVQDGAKPAAHAARELYDDRWMFHGPAYQGIVELGLVSERAISGVLETGAAKGSLIDNAGQLFGYWVAIHHDIDRTAMPVHIERVAFHGPQPQVGERIACTAWIHARADQSAKDVTADLELRSLQSGRVWATLEGWTVRRFETDARLWPVLHYPERSLMAEAREGGWMLFADHYRSAATRDQLARRFLGEAERVQYAAESPRNQRAWLTRRIVIKDAVRDYLWRNGHAPMFPVEIVLLDDDDGRTRVVIPARPEFDLRVATAQQPELVVARVAEGCEPQIGLEPIGPLPQGFSFSDAELALIALIDDARADSAPAAIAAGAEWLTRLYVAKQLVAKLQGCACERIQVADRVHERLLIAGVRVETRREKDHVVAWTNA